MSTSKPTAVSRISRTFPDRVEVRGHDLAGASHIGSGEAIAAARLLPAE